MDTPMSVHKDLFDLNVFGVMSLTLEVLPSMVERKKGHIVTTSSVAGKLGELIVVSIQKISSNPCMVSALHCTPETSILLYKAKMQNASVTFKVGSIWLGHKNIG